MIKTAERRIAILNILCERRKETLDNLAFELGVCKATVKRDIIVLSYSYPIYATPGIGGGIQVVDGFRLGMKYLTDKQYTVLKGISERLSGEEKIVVQEILKIFAYPIGEKNGKKRT